MSSAIQSIISRIAILLFVLLTSRSFAQTNRFSLSINSLTTNYNYGKLNNALAPYKKNFTGLQAGFSYQAGITRIFSVVPELYFAMKGGRLKENNPITTGKSTLRIYSLEMPVLARLHCNQLYLNAGPYTGYNVGGRLKVEASGTTPHSSTKVSFGNGVSDLKHWDFGWMAGAGYNLNLKRSVLTLDARYSYGLTKLSHDVARYNRVLNISLAVSKPGKKK